MTDGIRFSSNEFKVERRAHGGQEEVVVLIATDDGQFGFIIAELPGLGLFHFQVVVEGHAIGDADGTMLGSAVYRLANLKSVDHEDLAQLEDRVSIFEFLNGDDIHDAVTLSVAESLDQWLIRAFIQGERVVFMAQEFSGENLVGPIFVSIVDRHQYDSIVESVRSYWEAHGGNAPGRAG